MHTQTILLALAAAFVAQLCYILYKTLTSPLRAVPGPLAARFTKLWYFHRVSRGQAHHDNIALHRKHAPPGSFYAPVVRLGPNMYSLSRPEKPVYGIASKTEKSSWYEGWQHPSPERWTMFTDRNARRHAETRKLFAGMFSLSSLLHYEAFVESAGEIFRERLRELSSREGEGVDMHHWLQCYAFDVVGNITFGRRFGFLDEGRDIEHCMASLEVNMKYSTLVGVYAWMHPWLYAFMEKWFPQSGAAARSYLMGFVGREIARREPTREAAKAQGRRPGPEGDAPRDFLDLAMDAEQDPEKAMTKYHVFMIAMSNVIAGSDTTAVSLSSILWNLTSHPEVLAELRRELDGAIAEGKMTADKISFKQSQDLPFFQACIKEALRVCAATGLPLWRVIPEGGVEMLGHYFPEGTEVGINVWVAHYDEDIWGPDAAQYRPQRWIDAQNDPDRLKLMESFFMPFGLGSRTCIGRHISFLEICKVIPMIVSNFDLVLERPTEELETENFWFVRPTDFRVKVKARKQQ